MNCKRFERCSAPLCPLDSELEMRIWYPDESICSRTDIRTDWIKKQMRIKKKVKDRESYYTVDMLNAVERVFKGLKGVNPDKPDVRKWIMDYKKRRANARNDWIKKENPF